MKTPFILHSVSRITLMAGLLMSLATHAESFSTLEEQMTGKEYKAAGLNKLSAEELKNLNNWLHSNITGRTVAAYIDPNADEDIRGFKDKGDKTPIYSSIDGEFTGWRGKTKFKLANGQIWQQIGDDEFRVKLSSPEISIQPAMFDSWKMKVSGYNASIKVRRLK